MNSNKSKGKFLGFLRKKQLRYGSYAALMTAIVLAVIVLLNIAVGAIESNWALTMDLSGTGLYSITDQTKEVLSDLNQEVIIYTTYTPDYSQMDKNQVNELITRYQALNKNIRSENIDPLTDPLKVNAFKKDNASTISNGTVIVTTPDGKRFKTFTRDELYNIQYDQDRNQYYATGFIGESKLTSGIMFVTAEKTPKVYFLSGHQENDYEKSSFLRAQLENENYQVAKFDFTGDVKLEAGDTLVILSPRIDLLDSERDTLKEFITNGGRLFFAAGYEMPTLPNFESLLGLFNVGFKNAILVEPADQTTNYIYYQDFLIPNYKEHDITKPLTANTTRMIIPTSRAIAMPELPISGVVVSPLLTTSNRAYLKATASQDTSLFEKKPEDETGEFVIAATITRDYQDPSKNVRMVVVGNSEMTSDTQLITSTNNIDFIISAMNWLVDQKIGVSIRAKSLGFNTITIPDAASVITLAILVVAVIPLLIIITGIIIWLRRRHL